MVWRFRSGKIDRILDYCVYPPARMVECALWFVPFTRASSGGLAGKRAAVCLRLAEPSSADPRQAEQRSEPEGPRSRVPGGIAKGGWASSPPWLAVKAKGGFSCRAMSKTSN